MKLRTAVLLVCIDVADCVYAQPTAARAVLYARHEISDAELANTRDDQQNGRFDDPTFNVDGEHDVYGAYELVRAAPEHDVWAIAVSMDD
jgi:hypothetical protein